MKESNKKKKERKKIRLKRFESRQLQMDTSAICFPFMRPTNRKGISNFQRFDLFRVKVQ